MTSLLTVGSLDRRTRRVLLERILSGEMPPDANVNEAELAGELGISRTPLRQALVRLEQEGFVYAEPNRGYFVAPLTLDEARELYPILGALECLGLRESRPGPEGIGELERLNRRLLEADPGDPAAAARLNLKWHEALLAGCVNGQLLRLLHNLRQQAYRYEVSFFAPGEDRLRKSGALHRSILEALRDGNVDLACTRLREHWMTDLNELAPRHAEIGRLRPDE